MSTAETLRFAGVVRRDGFALDAQIEAEPGEVLAVLGPNGAGKSTLLRSLAGLLLLDTGSISLGEQVWDRGQGDAWPAEKRPVGLVFQDYRLFPHLSVLDNVGFASRSAGASKATAREHARAWLARLGLDVFAARLPTQLSGGQAQRVALARALAREPGLLLLDEPLAALDSRTRLDVRGNLKKHLSTFAGPTLLVTHDPLDATVLADRIVVLEGGAVVQRGTPLEVARQPATEYVAKLVGLNLWAGSQEGTTVRLADGGELVVASDRCGPALVALRPSAVSVHTHPPAAGSPRNVWRGTINSLELLGDRVRLGVSGPPDTLVDLTPTAVMELDLEVDTPVWLSAKATEIDAYENNEAGSALPAG